MASRAGATISLSCEIHRHDFKSSVYIIMEKLVVPQDIVIIVQIIL